jgi:hypothetical protein
MAGKIHIHNILLLAALFLLLISSCATERKFAREFIKNDSSYSALVMAPDYVFKYSLKEWQIDRAWRTDEWLLDSILWENSLFIKYIYDSIFLDLYVGSYVAELEALGFTVYPEDSLINFLSGRKDSFIMHIAQLELEEYVEPVLEYEEIGEYIYYEYINLNAINLNSWIEINSLNDEEDKSVFFANEYITDELEGYFKHYYFTGEVEFRYQIDTLLLDHIYNLAAYTGYTYAGYTYDYLLNKYIDKRVEEERVYRTDITYYHYDRRKRYLSAAKLEERFVPLEE